MGAPQHPGGGFAPHPSMPGPAGPGGMRWGAAPPMGGPGPTGPPPGMLHPHAAPMGPPHGAPVPAVEPEKEPYNILSFPAGLIPKLTRNHLKCALLPPPCLPAPLCPCIVPWRQDDAAASTGVPDEQHG